MERSAMRVLAGLFARFGSPRNRSVLPEPVRVEPVWDGDDRLRIAHVRFRLMTAISDLHAAQSTLNDFVLGKTRKMVEDTVRLSVERPGANVFEMGIFKGGSVVLNHLLFRPRRLVAIEFNPQPSDVLAHYIASSDPDGTIRAYYGVDQGDSRVMLGVLAKEFPARDIDLVVDDASHFYEETRAAFNAVFPFVTPGGLYVIEDWAWAHWPGDFWQKDNPYFGKKRALSNLLIELFMLCGSRPDLVQSVDVDRETITVTRGTGAAPEKPFDVSDHYLLRGRRFEPPL
jgi:hypothetical protein